MAETCLIARPEQQLHLGGTERHSQRKCGSVRPLREPMVWTWWLFPSGLWVSSWCPWCGSHPQWNMSVTPDSQTCHSTWVYQGVRKLYSKEKSESCSIMSGSLWPCGLHSPWNSPGQNTGVGSLSFSGTSSQPRDRTHVSCIGRQILYQGSPRALYVF